MKTSILPLSVLLIFGIQTYAAEKEVILFDGKNLDNFEFAPGSWEIEKDGSVVCRMQETKDKKG